MRIIKPVDARILLIFDEIFMPIVEILDEAKSIFSNQNIYRIDEFLA